MPSIDFNPKLNLTPVEVYNEAPATGAAETKAPAAKPTLTQVGSTAAETTAVSSSSVQSLPPPDVSTQADAADRAQTAMEGLQQLPPGSGVAANAMQQMSALRGLAGALADQASQPGGDAQATAKMAGQVETMAGSLAEALRDQVTNSRYPDFTSVLKELMSLAQELKEAASQVKMAAIEGKYDLQMAGASKLRDAAVLDASAREKNIKTERTQAWISLGASALGGLASFLPTAGPTLGNALNALGTSGTTLLTTGNKLEASTDQLNADLMRADKGKLDAEATKQDASIQTIDEMEEAAKKLREAALQGLGTLISNHAQIMRSATEV
jgi:hypothetical protein